MRKPFSLCFPGVIVPGGDPEVKETALHKERLFLQVKLCEDAAVTDSWCAEAGKALIEYYSLRDAIVERVVHKKTVPVEKREDTQILFGKPPKTKLRDIDAIEYNDKPTAVRGRVITLEMRETRAKKTLITFDLADNTGAIRVSGFFEETIAKKMFAAIEKVRDKGDYLDVFGRCEYDSYKQADTWLLRPTAIMRHERKLRADNAPEKRVELHLHTTMSQNDALIDVGNLVERAAKWGHNAVAITDHGVCHSFPDAMKHGKKHGVKILYGMEGYMPSGGKRHEYHIILIAKNEVGLKNLYTIVSRSHVEHFHYRPLIPRELLDSCREGLIVGAACEAGELFRAIVARAPHEELVSIARRYDYLEIQPLCNNRFLVREKLAENEEELKDFNRTIVALGEELNIPVCATCDAHFMEKEDELYRRVLLADTDMLDSEPLSLYYRTTEEMLEEFSYLGAEKAYEVVVKNTNYIAGLCEPIKPVKSGEYSPVIAGSAEALRELAYEKAHRLFGEKLPEILTERMEKELTAITGKGYDVIYIIAQKIVSRSIENGYYVGSRGSVGSSIVAFMAGISEINALPPHYLCAECHYYEFPENPSALCGVDMPDKLCPVCGARLNKDGFGLNFAIFLGFEADKRPDIDLNFSDEYQSRAHEHTVEIFGASQVYRAGTITTMQINTARGYAKKYLEKQNLPLDNDAEVNRLAIGCVGIKTTTGQHPGGLVVVPVGYEIADFCPVHYPANDRKKMITTHFDYHAVEENLLKLDLLGHTDPTMIRFLENLTGVNVMDIPLDDPDTLSLFTSSAVLGYENDPILGKTGAVAVSEFGTRFVRGMLIATKPACFDDLLKISGLSHGTNVWMGNQEELVRTGVATLREIICARDDIMLYLISKGLDRKLSFNIMESVRKGKKLTKEWESAMRGANVPEWYITSCNKIEYMFPKSHAAAYVMMAFRIAWFKVHRPLAFYAAYFTKRAKQFDAFYMTLGIDTVKKRIKSIEKMSNPSDTEKNQLVTLEVVYEYYLRGFNFGKVDLDNSHATDFLVTDENTLLPPFISMPSLGEVVAKTVVEAREKQPFMSVEDLSYRTKLNKSVIDSLKEIGALSTLPESTQMSLF